MIRLVRIPDRVFVLLSAFALFLVGFCGRTVSAADVDTFEAALNSITEKELKRHIDFLASDTLEGREAGTQGGYAAGAYIVQELTKAGVKPAGADDGFYQYFHPNFRNILAVLPGSDAELRDEYVLVGAHYDHVGYGNRFNSRGPIGQIHNGADDNASGTAGVLEVAEALASLDKKPRRSILFVLWDGEEKGLLGSKFYTSYPLISTDRIRFHINIDMIGRLKTERFELYGWRTAFGLRQFVSRHNGDELDIDFMWEYRADSDHWPFFEFGVPSLMFHTGKHADYHRPSDDTHKIDIGGARSLTRLMLRLATKAANSDELPKFRRESLSEAESLPAIAKRWANLQGLPSRLGVSYDAELSKKRRVKVTRVVRDSAADTAGLETGDEIVEFGGHLVKDHADFRTLVLTARNPVPVRILRDDEEQSLNVELQGEAVVFGFQWRHDDAEPGVLPVIRVLPGSPAERSGLRRGHRIVRLNGQRPGTDDELKELLSNSTDAVKVEIEARGRIKTIELDPALK